MMVFVLSITFVVFKNSGTSVLLRRSLCENRVHLSYIRSQPHTGCGWDIMQDRCGLSQTEQADLSASLAWVGMPGCLLGLSRLALLRGVLPLCGQTNGSGGQESQGPEWVCIEAMDIIASIHATHISAQKSTSVSRYIYTQQLITKHKLLVSPWPECIWFKLSKASTLEQL